MYHVNPVSGEIGTCHAKSPETCPFGSFNHSDSLEKIKFKKNKFKKPTEKELNDKKGVREKQDKLLRN